MKDGEKNLLGEVVDKANEYFQIKGVLKTLRNDLKDLKENNEDFQELESLSKKVKELRLKIKQNEDIL